MVWLRFLLVFLVFFPAVASAEDEVVGSIKTVVGSAVVVRSGSLIEARPGIRLQRGDVLRTGENGRLGVILRDDTLLSLGGDTEMDIEEFAFAPGEERLSLVLRIVRGVAVFLSGKISKLAPEAVRVETPVGTVGVRGTRFLIRIDG
jgi:hypothetical protein